MKKKEKEDKKDTIKKIRTQKLERITRK